MELLILATVAAVIIYWMFRQRDRDETAQRRHDATAPAAAFRWPALGEFDFEVVGESHYQQALRRLAQPHDEHGADKQCVAELIPERDNPHDPQAVRVAIDGNTVGYLSRDDARSFRRRLSSRKRGGQVTACDAVIRGGGVRDDGERLFYGVWLDIKPFD
jgi:hypothetical protein